MGQKGRYGDLPLRVVDGSWGGAILLRHITKRSILKPDAFRNHAKGFTHLQEIKDDKTHYVEHGHP